ncbi:MAG: hypothetical protein WD075_06270 [Rhodospirillales bacterium]
MPITLAIAGNHVAQISATPIRDGHIHAGTTMTSDCRILIASRNTGDAWGAHLKLEREGRWHVVGIVDPRAKPDFDDGCEMADVVMIEAQDLIWLLDHRSIQTGSTLESSRPVVLLEERDILEIVSRGERTWGLLVEQRIATMSVERLALATENYLVITTNLLQHLRRDGLRLDIVETLSCEELIVLSRIGLALSNQGIAAVSKIMESRVKAIIRILARKLQLKNRTALAVFAVENETLLSLMAEKTPKSRRRRQRIRSNADAKEL